MKRILTYLAAIFVAVAGSHSAAAVQGTGGQPDLAALYLQLDEAIEQAPQYVAEREQQIGHARRLFLAESNREKRLLLAEQLFGLFKPFRNDSALSYAAMCVALADSLHRPDLAGRYRSLMARQYSNADQYVEALEQLRQVDRKALDRRGLTAYYEAWMHVCGQIGSYSQLKDIRQGYYDRQDLYRDSVLQVAEEGSEEFLHLKMDVLCARRQYQDALSISDSWLGKVADGTHENAFAAFYRSVVYDNLGNAEQVRYWLGKSALDDIRCAVRDQAALLFLANRLAEDGDLARASRYVQFSRESNLAFLPHLRVYQVNSVVSVAEKCRQASDAKSQRLMFVACALAGLLVCLLLLLIFQRNRKCRRQPS